MSYMTWAGVVCNQTPALWCFMEYIQRVQLRNCLPLIGLNADMLCDSVYSLRQLQAFMRVCDVQCNGAIQYQIREQFADS